MHTRTIAIAFLALAAGGAASGIHADTHTRMGFFITSVGSGNGANLGGLAGADKHCQTLAAAAGRGDRTWRAYLSTSVAGGAKAVNARDRIGRGPWYNARYVLIAKDVDDLHFNGNITKQTALTEKGQVVNGRGDKPNMHDILTGSDSQGRAFPGTSDTTCSNWTSSTAGSGSAQVGHHDRVGLDTRASMLSWNHAHPSRGCSQDNLRATGGDGLFYCFAAK
jgi:hypothetical protein